jgi:hypothetical protein
MRIVLADDSVLLRAGLARLLEDGAHDRPEGGVVIDDQNGAGHTVIVGTLRQHLNGAGRTPAAGNRTAPGRRAGGRIRE